MHYEEAAGDLALGLTPFSVGYGGMSDVFMKESAEGSEALKAHLETDIRYAEFVASKQFFCFLDTAFDQVLVRSLMKCLPEETEEMVARETGLLGNLFETERMVVAVIDEVTRTAKPL